MEESENLKPEEILNTTTKQVRAVVEKILTIEKEFQHYKNIPKSKENEIAAKILNLFHGEIN